MLAMHVTHIVLVPILACISCRLWVVCAARSAQTGTRLYCGHAYCRHSGAISCMGECWLLIADCPIQRLVSARWNLAMPHT